MHVSIRLQIIIKMSNKIYLPVRPEDTIWDLKQLAAAHIGTRPEKLRIQKAKTIFKDHITL